jgi:hypothetical protein
MSTLPVASKVRAVRSLVSRMGCAKSPGGSTRCISGHDYIPCSTADLWRSAKAGAALTLPRL